MTLIQSNSANFLDNRQGHALTRGYFHRTAVQGDTAMGEAVYFKNHVVHASAHVFIDLNGVTVESLPITATGYSVDELDENFRSYSIEFTGLNGTKLTPKAIAAAIAFIKSKPALMAIHNHRLTLTEIPAGKVSGWGNHVDVTRAYKIYGGHTDGISNIELAVILKGVYA